MSGENGSSSGGGDKDLAMFLGIAMAFVAIPFFLKLYVLPYYAYGWYKVHYFTTKGLWFLISLPNAELIANKVVLWPKLFLWDFNLPDNSLKSLISSSLKTLLSVDATSADTIRGAIYDSEANMYNNFTMVGRFIFSVFAPVFMYPIFKSASYLWRKPEFKTKFNLDNFATTMSNAFFELLPVAYDNPQKHPSIDQGCWRMSPKIYKYLDDNGCLDFRKVKGGTRFYLNEQKTTELLVEQLGERFVGFDGMSINERRIVGTVMPMVVSPAKGKATTDELVKLYCLAFSSKPAFLKSCKVFVTTLFNFKGYFGKGGFFKVFSSFFAIKDGYKTSISKRKALKKADRLIDKTIEKLKDDPKVKAVVKRHAYNLTVMSGLIESARDGGVVPSCNFLWLKVHDRKLFYVFNNLGRHVAWVECVGFWSHYLAESKVKVPYPYPKVRNGLEGLDDYLFHSFDLYDPILDYDD